MNTIIAETTNQYYVHFKGSATSKPFYAIIHKNDPNQRIAAYDRESGWSGTPALQVRQDVRKMIKNKHSGGEAVFAYFRTGGEVLNTLIGENTRRPSVASRCKLI